VEDYIVEVEVEVEEWIALVIKYQSIKYQDEWMNGQQWCYEISVCSMSRWGQTDEKRLKIVGDYEGISIKLVSVVRA